MLHQGLSSFVRPGPLVLPKNIRETPMTSWSLMSSLDDLTSAWKYQIPVPCRVFVAAIKPRRKLTHLFGRPWDCGAEWESRTFNLGATMSNLRMLWVLEEQNQHDVTCYNWPFNGFKGFHRCTKGFNPLSDQGRGQLVLPKQRENPMTCRNLMSPLDDVKSAWKYQIPVQSALSEKDVNWPYGHSPNVDKFHPSNWATFFHKSTVMLLSLIPFCICLTRTDRRKGWVLVPRCWHLFGVIALSPMWGQPRLQLSDTAKYRNSRKGLFMQASINRRLVTKMRSGHMLIGQMVTSCALHIWQHSFRKVPSCICFWCSLFSCRWGLTETRPSTFAKMLTPFRFNCA